jgi:hypothetical protein
MKRLFWTYSPAAISAAIFQILGIYRLLETFHPRHSFNEKALLDL